MAKQPQRDDDQSKKPDGKQSPAPKTPKPAIPNMSLGEPGEAAPLEVEEVFEEDVPVVEAAPASDVEAARPVDDEVFAEEVIEEATASEVVEEAPVEAVRLTPQAAAEEEVFAAEAVEVVGSSAVLAEPEDVGAAAHPEAEPVIAAPPPSVRLEDVVARELAQAAPESDVKADDFVFDDAAKVSAPALEIGAAQKTVEAAPLSGVGAAEEIVEEAAPASEVAPAEEIVEEPAPASEVKGEGVLFDEAIAEAAPTSEAKSAEVAEELAEEVEEVSSATRKAEAVLEDEVAAAEAASGAGVIEEASAEEAVLNADEAEAVEAGSSSVLSDVAVDEGSAVKKPASAAGKTTDFDMTIGSAPPSSAAKKTQDDLPVTEVEVAGTSEASTLDLGDRPARKGSSVAGIDKVAEALESGVDLEAEETEPLAPSVEFDELLDDEGEATPVKKGKPAAKVDDDSTEIDAGPIEEAVGADDEEIVAGKKADKKTKKGKPAAKATGDDIDLDDYFGEAEREKAVGQAAEAEAAETFDAAHKEEAESAEAIDEEMEATEAFDAGEAEEAEAAEDEDERPKKKTKAGEKARMQEDDEKEDEDEEASAKKKKKGKPDMKDRAIPAPAAAQTSTFLRVFIGMFVATIMLAGGAAGAWFFAPEQIKDLAQTSPNAKKPKQDTPKLSEKSNLEKARIAMAEGNHQDAVKLLESATDPAEVGTRGEARWYAYFKQQTDKKEKLVKDAQAVKLAINDLKGKNDMFLDQMMAKLDENSLNAQVANLKIIQGKLEETKNAKEVAEKRFESVADVLAKGRVIDDKAKIDVVMLQKTLKELADDRSVLETVNEILKDAKIKGAGEEGIKEVLKIKKGLEDNVAAVDKVLRDEKIKDRGAKGVLEIVAHVFGAHSPSALRLVARKASATV